MAETVSIIIPLYNSADFIETAIKSVVSQTYQNWEMVVVDDCSTDNSYALVEKFARQDNRIKILKLLKNSGAAVARNTGIKAAVGRYLAFLDSDDIWFPNKLETQLHFMQMHNYPFVYAAYEKIDESGRFLYNVQIPRRVSYSQLLKTNVIGCFMAIYDTDYFGKIEMPLIRKRQDFGLWLQLLKKIEYAYGIQESLGAYRIRSGSVSSKKLGVSAYNWQLYRQIEKLSLLSATYYFSHYAVRGLIRRHLPKLAHILHL